MYVIDDDDDGGGGGGDDDDNDNDDINNNNHWVKCALSLLARFPVDLLARLLKNGEWLPVMLYAKPDRKCHVRLCLNVVGSLAFNPAAGIPVWLPSSDLLWFAHMLVL